MLLTPCPCAPPPDQSLRSVGNADSTGTLPSRLCDSRVLPGVVLWPLAWQGLCWDLP